ncbi:unnamed protein product [Closterium sp. NIES-65]|nr:unnamed protein product [Closterium sp. NIES-65]
MIQKGDASVTLLLRLPTSLSCLLPCCTNHGAAGVPREAQVGRGGGGETSQGGATAGHAQVQEGVKLLSRAKHKHLVQLLGCCREAQEKQVVGMRSSFGAPQEEGKERIPPHRPLPPFLLSLFLLIHPSSILRGGAGAASGVRVHRRGREVGRDPPCCLPAEPQLPFSFPPFSPHPPSQSTPPPSVSGDAAVSSAPQASGAAAGELPGGPGAASGLRVMLLSRAHHKHLLQLLVYEFIGGGKGWNPPATHRTSTSSSFPRSPSPTLSTLPSHLPLCQVMLLSRARHKHLVQLLGYCREEQEQLLVYEFIGGGTLSHNLNAPWRARQNKPPLNWTERLLVAAGTARALAYLHDDVSMPFIHRDVKPGNILLDRHVVAKLADFGTSRAVDTSSYSATIQGTAGYCDPDYLKSGQPSKRIDVYSFGIVLLELITGKSPRGISRPYRFHVQDLLDKKGLAGIVDQSMGIYPEKEVTSVLTLAFKCTDIKNPAARPSMNRVVTELESVLEPERVLPVTSAVTRQIHHQHDISLSRGVVDERVTEAHNENVQDIGESNNVTVMEEISGEVRQGHDDFREGGVIGEGGSVELSFDWNLQEGGSGGLGRDRRNASMVGDPDRPSRFSFRGQAFEDSDREFDESGVLSYGPINPA